LVQSIPTDMPELPAVPGVLRTGDVLQWLAGNSSKSLDIMSYYWELLALPKNPASGDYGYSQQQLDQFGAPVGQAVYDSLIAAADRGVPIR
jgi:phospholipase D3/4